MPQPLSEIARERLAARARRIARIRRGVFAATIAAFALAWAVIAWNGSMGTTATASPGASTTSSSAGTTSSSSSSQDNSSSADAPAPIITSQS
jgi:predicted metal-binding membrane protein